MILNLLTNKEVHDYVVNNLQSSLSSVGFSKTLVNDLTENLDHLELQQFRKEYSAELNEVYTIGFFQRLVPEYFSHHVVPEIPSSDEILDLGCGTGILASILAKEDRFKHITGIDLHRIPNGNYLKIQKQHLKLYRRESFLIFCPKKNQTLQL